MSERGIDVANHLWVAVCGAAYARILLDQCSAGKSEFLGHASTPESIAKRRRVLAMLDAMRIADGAMDASAMVHATEEARR